jgi:hypothetical protein
LTSAAVGIAWPIVWPVAVPPPLPGLTGAVAVAVAAGGGAYVTWGATAELPQPAMLPPRTKKSSAGSQPMAIRRRIERDRVRDIGGSWVRAVSVGRRRR